MEQLEAEGLEAKLGLSFEDGRLLQQALVHSSYLNEAREFDLGSNERLEFLGDAVLDMVVAEELYRRFPGLSEGALTSLRSSLVKGSTLAKLADRLDLGSYLYVGTGEEASGGRHRQRNLAGALEALVGAIYLDQGLDKTRALCLGWLEEDIARLEGQGLELDPKSSLQELVQARGSSPPEYRTKSSLGPDHARWFIVEVQLSGQVVAQGEGRSKRAAEVEAARAALRELMAERGKEQL